MLKVHKSTSKLHTSFDLVLINMNRKNVFISIKKRLLKMNDFCKAIAGDYSFGTSKESLNWSFPPLWFNFGPFVLSSIPQPTVVTGMFRGFATW